MGLVRYFAEGVAVAAATSWIIWMVQSSTLDDTHIYFYQWTMPKFAYFVLNELIFQNEYEIFVKKQCNSVYKASLKVEKQI